MRYSSCTASRAGADRRLVERLARLDLQQAANLRFRDRRGPGHRDLAEHGARALDDHDRRADEGNPSFGARFGRAGLHAGPAEAPRGVKTDQGPDRGVEMGLDIERPGLEHDQRPYLLDRHRLIAGDLHAFRHDPKGRAFPHEEDDVELSLRLQRTDGDVGFPEPLLLQVGTDAADRILEQVFVDRTLALERHQFGRLVGGQRIAFEADGDDRAGQRCRASGQRCGHRRRPAPAGWPPPAGSRGS